MTTETQNPTLASLEYIPYLDDSGAIAEDLQNKIGVYAIFNQEKILQFVGYSRDIYLSLKQHLVRQPYQCYWLKYQTITKPSRSILAEIRQAWLGENGTTPEGNGSWEAQWNEPINAKLLMTDAEKAEYEQNDEIGKNKLLKKIARRVQEEIIEPQLKERGVAMEIRFNPKLKEEGLLDLK